MVASEVIEHVEEPHKFVACLVGLLAEEGGDEKGHLIVSTINRTFKSYLLAIVGAE